MSDAGHGRARAVRMLTLWLLAVGAASCDSGTPFAPTLAFGEAADDQQVELSVGQRFLVSLESNPSTGYRWEIAELDTSVVAQAGEPSFAASSDLVGASGFETWRFQAVAAGETELRLVYRRPWEQEPPLQSYTLHLSVS